MLPFILYQQYAIRNVQIKLILIHLLDQSCVLRKASGFCKDEKIHYSLR
jgi:hypothetical protein